MDTTKKEFLTVDQYIELYPSDVKSKLITLKQLIKHIVPEALETIKYRMPTYVLNGHNLIHFAAYKKHIGFYPTPSAIEKFKNELKKYSTSKGAIQFQLNEPIPFDLVTKIVKFRVSENNKK